LDDGMKPRSKGGWLKERELESQRVEIINPRK